MDRHMVVVNQHGEEIKKYLELAIELRFMSCGTLKLRYCHWF